jgi:hypothetical protein
VQRDDSRAADLRARLESQHEQLQELTQSALETLQQFLWESVDSRSASRTPASARNFASVLTALLSIPQDRLHGLTLTLDRARGPIVTAVNGAALATEEQAVTTRLRLLPQSGTGFELNRKLLRALGLLGKPVLGLSIDAGAPVGVVATVRLHVMDDQAADLLTALHGVLFRPEADPDGPAWEVSCSPDTRHSAGDEP